MKKDKLKQRPILDVIKETVQEQISGPRFFLDTSVLLGVVKGHQVILHVTREEDNFIGDDEDDCRLCQTDLNKLLKSDNVGSKKKAGA